MANWSETKRFYKKVEVIENQRGFRISLDGTFMKTPGGAELCVPSFNLAKAMREEWCAQSNYVNPKSMPINKLSATVIDRVKKSRKDVISITLKLAETDLLCYRAKEPIELVELQNKCWQPELNWIDREFNVSLKVTTEILPVIQPEVSLISLHQILDDLDDFLLLGVSNAAASAGSLVLALSLLNRRIGAEEMFMKSILEEEFQMEKWGVDEETVKRHHLLREDILESEKFLNLLEK